MLTIMILEERLSLGLSTKIVSDENLEVWMTSGGLNHIPQQDVPAVQKLVNTFLLFFSYTALTLLPQKKIQRKF